MEEKKTKIKKDLCRGTRTLKSNSKNSGITLVALVVTIIVLLILAGVTITQLSNNKLLVKSEQAKDESNIEKYKEQLKLKIYEVNLQKAGKATLEDIVEYLKKDIEEYVIDIGELATINGTIPDLSKAKSIDITYKGYIYEVNRELKIEYQGKEGELAKIFTKNIKITTQEDTENEVINYSQENGTQLVINFESGLKDGEITKIEPSIPYITNGVDKVIEFVITATRDGKEYIKKENISVESKYLKSFESLIDGVESITTGGITKIQVNGKANEVEETIVYNANVIYHEGDLELNGTDSFDNITPNSNKIYQYGDATLDVAKETTGTTNYAKNMVILKVDGDLTIDEGVTLTTVASASGYGGPKGFMIYCTGTLSNNGKIDMTARGARAEGQNVYLWKNTNNTYEYVPAVGADGGESVTGGALVGTNGNNGINRETGGGGSGAAVSYGSGTQKSGSGSKGTSYSGGTGGRWCFCKKC